MKFRCLILLVLLLSGCGNEASNSSLGTNADEKEVERKIDNAEPTTKPDLINLAFSPLQMDELQLDGAVSVDWEMLNSIPFGQINGNDVTLEIYKATSKDENLRYQLNGALKIQEMQFIIPNLSNSFLENDIVECPQMCLFQRLFSNQKQFELLGSLELFSNGPGLKLYLVYDLFNKKLNTFTSWGEPNFIDLDDDGNDEFIIEFLGLHLSWPDIFFISASNGQIEISESVINSIQKNQGDYAKIIKDNKPPIISISNIHSENQPIYTYIYNDGVLEKINIQ